jgi:hypothetical protein
MVPIKVERDSVLIEHQALIVLLKDIVDQI